MRTAKRGWRNWILILLLASIVVSLSVAICLITIIDIPPRRLAPYIEKRVSQHNPALVMTGNFIAEMLRSFDRGNPLAYIPPLHIGGAHKSDPYSESINDPNFVSVRSPSQFLNAINQAKAGDVITLEPGTYLFRGQYIPVAQAGTESKRIVVRAERADSVFFDFDLTEGFLVSAPYWSFENLNIQGVCTGQGGCEHAFHVAGGATHFVARNNTIINFNAHFKINGAGGKMPDHGLVEGNILTNSAIRQTASAVTPIDLVAASGWVLRRNFISDFIKAGSNQISFGAFAKGGGSENRFEQNIVICENKLKGASGQRVGISLGGGGTGARYCRDGRCITEQDRSVIEANLIVSCSDDGIYVNRSAKSKVRHNTVIDTGGVTIKFPETSADVDGNIVDGSIRSRDDGILRKTDNLEDAPINSYIGRHPIREVYNNDGKFSWHREPVRRGAVSHPPLDLCGKPRPIHPAYGAFERFSDCLKLVKQGQSEQY